MRALAMDANSGNCSPAPDLVLTQLIFQGPSPQQCVFLAGMGISDALERHRQVHCDYDSLWDCCQLSFPRCIAKCTWTSIAHNLDLAGVLQGYVRVNHDHVRSAILTHGSTATLRRRERLMHAISLFICWHIVTLTCMYNMCVCVCMYARVYIYIYIYICTII